MSLGAGLMCLFDPDRGKRRRALVRDKLAAGVHHSNRGISKAIRDVDNRFRGVVAGAQGFFQHSLLENVNVDDDILALRVRARIGRVVSHSGAIEVAANHGNVTVKGPVLRNEIERLVTAISSVPGVRKVDNHLEPHYDAEGVPGLQGGRVRPANPGWKPAYRLAAGAGGGVLAA